MRLIRIFTITVWFLCLAASVSAKTFPEGLIVPGERIGYISGSTTEADLIRDFGEDNVLFTLVDIGEGIMIEATILLPQDTLRTMQVFWKETEPNRYPTSVRFKGTKSIWKTQEGITLGTTLKELEAINGAPFSLTGFQWDYEGTVLHCGEGKLKCLGEESFAAVEYPPRTLLLRLRPDWKTAFTLYEDELNQVSGMNPVYSDFPAMQKINPHVYEMYVYFPENNAE